MIENTTRNTVQLIWGIALVLMGIAMFFRIPQVMPQIRTIDSFVAVLPFIRFCFYFMALILIGGGLKKIIAHFSRRSEPNRLNNGP